MSCSIGIIKITEQDTIINNTDLICFVVMTHRKKLLPPKKFQYKVCQSNE